MKNLFDLTLATVAALTLSLLFLFLVVALFTLQGRPIFFKQERSGLGGAPFFLYKFRSMRTDPAPDGAVLSDEVRLLPFGKFMRYWSLDELPQIWNVLRRDMSVVGPRPLPKEYLGLYSAEQSRRHEVRPGITGWAQVNGRNAISWEEKFKLDVWYVDHQSFWLDVKILFLTAYVVLTRRGISAQGEATMPKFQGTVKQ